MKTRLLALGLCLCLVLGLTACASKNNNQPTSDPEISLAPDGEPLPSLAPDGEPALTPVDPSDRPSDAPESQSPDLSEVHTQPIQTPPSAEPSRNPVQPEVTPETAPEPARDFTAADLYAMWLTTSSQFPAPAAAFADMSAYVEAYYPLLDRSDVESFVFYQPDMSATPQDVFIAKAKPGKVSAVKAACQDRLEAMEEETRFYTGTDDYVKSAKLETAGDWCVLAVCPEADRLVKIVKDTAK